MEFKLDYFILTFIYFFFIYICGINRKKQKDSLVYWKYASIPIILFSIIEGCRYGRGADYLWYMEQYYSILSPIEEQDPLFMWIFENLYLLDIPFWGVTILFALIWIICIYIFLQNYKDIAPWGIIFFLIFSLILFESAIRQFLSLSFVLVACYFLCKKNNILFFLTAFIACSIHLSSIIYIIVIYLISLYKQIFNWKITLVIYLFFVFIWDFSKSNSLVLLVTLIDLGSNKLSSYITNADSWFSANAAQHELIRSFPVKCFSAILDSFVIIGGYKVAKILNRPSLCLLYNLSMIGVLGLYGAFTFEITRRIFHPLYYLSGIILAYCLIYRELYLNSKCRPIIAIIQMLILYLWIKNILLSHAGQLFIWDVPAFKL